MKEFVHDKPFLGRKRPDYRNDELKLIVEFDGYAHYTTAKGVLDDVLKDELYTGSGYRVVRIPYFVQLSTETVKSLFDIDYDFEQKYPPGFVDRKCVLPADFCTLGLKRFLCDFRKLPVSVRKSVLNSLYVKIGELGNSELVVPEHVLLELEKEVA
jgi:hypothetical protein